MWSQLYLSIIQSSLDDSTKLYYLVLSFWAVLGLMGFGSGLLFSLVSRIFLKPIE